MQGLIVLVLIGGSFIAIARVPQRRLLPNEWRRFTVNQRLATTEAGFHMFLDHPLLGIQFRCSLIAWPFHAPEGIRSRNALVTHNTFIQALSETGALGFIPFVLLIGFSIYHARRMALYSSAPDLGAAVEVSLWGLVFCGNVGRICADSFSLPVAGVAAAARTAYRSRGGMTATQETPPPTESVFKPVMSLMFGRTLAFAATFFIPVVLARVFEPVGFATLQTTLPHIHRRSI